MTQPSPNAPGGRPESRGSRGGEGGGRGGPSPRPGRPGEYAEGGPVSWGVPSGAPEVAVAARPLLGARRTRPEVTGPAGRSHPQGRGRGRAAPLEGPRPRRSAQVRGRRREPGPGPGPGPRLPRSRRGRGLPRPASRRVTGAAAPCPPRASRSLPGRLALGNFWSDDLTRSFLPFRF